MKLAVKRVIMAGTNSGCGKTTVTCAVMQALKNRGLDVGGVKCGPDYIDPMFHRRVIGAPSSNLDPFFFDAGKLKYLLAKNCASRDICVIEGVMGYYDGIGLTSTQASTYDLARLTDSPVVLTVSARGAALSVIAQIQGFLAFEADNNIKAVILNDCTESAYKLIAPEIEKRLGIRTLGFLPRLRNCAVESRHLGLVTADEVTDLKLKMQRLAEQAEKSIDLDGLLAIAGAAKDIDYEDITLPKLAPIRVAVARDNAFCFYYEDSLDVIKSMGAELVEFSPMDDSAIPAGVDGIYLGGGYPELYAEKLSQNISMRSSIAEALKAGLPCIAECGGFMYLTQAIAGQPMVGFINGESHDMGKLTRFGYVTLTAERDNMLCKKGDRIPAHEFHHWDCDNTGDCFTARKKTGREWKCVFANETLYAGFPHFHFLANTDFAVNFYKACLKEKQP